MSTDFREYSAAFHDHQNDLMHYGVPGMKWHKRKAKSLTEIMREQAEKRNKKSLTKKALTAAKESTSRLSAMSHPDGKPMNFLSPYTPTRDEKINEGKDQVIGRYYKGGNKFGPIAAKANKTTFADVASDYEKKKKKKNSLTSKGTAAYKKRKQHEAAERAYRRGGH